MAAVTGLLVTLPGTGASMAAGQPLRSADVPDVEPDLPVTAMNQGVGVANNTPDLALHPHDDRFVAMANRLDAPDFGCALQLSGDGGRRWLTVDPVGELPAGVEKCYGAEAAFDDEGRLYFLFVGLAGGGNQPVGAFLVVSRDRGQSFSTPREVVGPLAFGVRLAVGPGGRLHLVWLQATSDPSLGGFATPRNPVLSAFSDDGGLTWSDPVRVSDPERARVVAPALAVAPDGVVHVAYLDLGEDARDYQGLEGPVWEGTWSLVVSTSSDRAASFAAGVVVDGAVAPHERVLLVFTMPPPALVAGAGRACVGWTDARLGDADVMVSCSPDRGETWQPAVRANDDAVGNGRDQYLPALGLSPDGRLDVVFYDRRADDENIHNDVSYTYATRDAGFAPNLTLTTEPSDTRIGQRYVHAAALGLVEFGSRLAVASRADQALAAWGDTRNSKIGTTGQDLFAASATWPAPSGRAGWTLAAGAGLAVLGIGGVVVAVARRGSWRGARRPAVVSAALGLLVVAGVWQSLAAAPPWPPVPPVVEVVVTDERIAFDRPVPAGRVVFEVVNAGRAEHRLALLPLPEDVPPIDEQLRGQTRLAVPPYAGVPDRRPGQRGVFAADLVPGVRYALIDFSEGPGGRPHALQGLNAEFRAGER